jgi:hypothetical protein
VAAQHPGNLTISGAPGRKGTYLYLEKGSRLIALARFMDADAVATFETWVRTCAAEGLEIRWTGTEPRNGP